MLNDTIQVEEHVFGFDLQRYVQKAATRQNVSKVIAFGRDS